MTVFRGIIQAIFLAIFALLIVQGSVQAWIMFLALGWLVAALVGRIYCGWACPMGTLMRLQTWLYQKFNLPRFNLPKLKENKKARGIITALRVFMLAAFLFGMVAVRVWGVQLNIILYLVILGVAISFFFSEDFWHRICPHGAIMNVTSRVAPLGMKVDEDKCTACGLCEKVCPDQAISRTEDSKKRSIDNKECLVCYQCTDVCPTNAIDYGKLNKVSTETKESKGE